MSEGSHFADFAVDEPVDDDLGGGVLDGMVGDETQVFDVASGEGGDGLPDCEGDVGPVEGFSGGFSRGEGGDEAVAGGVFVVESRHVFPGDPVWIWWVFLVGIILFQGGFMIRGSILILILGCQ